MKNLILSFCLFSTVGFFPTDADARMRTLSGKTVYKWDLKKSDLNVRLRGVSVFSSRIVWVSGDKGSYARSIDGGATWQKGVVPGAEDLDFRDIEAQGAEIALVLSIGNGDKSRIYKTTDGGKSWTMTFRNQTPGAFFDAMAFWDH